MTLFRTLMQTKGKGSTQVPVHAKIGTR